MVATSIDESAFIIEPRSIEIFESPVLTLATNVPTTGEIEISLYEYGNDNIGTNQDWVRQIVPLSKDLDEISARLFALKTNGGNEYCGSVIHHATKNLKWEDDRKSLKNLLNTFRTV
jgi:hypothetical protein